MKPSQGNPFVRWLGLDRTVGLVVAGRAWSVLAGPITLIMIGTRLSSQEQGFYYAFGSVIGLTVFFELGLSSVILTFASHEKAHLEWTSDGMLAGRTASKQRLASLARGATRWYAAVAALAIAVLLPGGWAFFAQTPGIHVSDWQSSWTLIVAGTASSLLFVPALGLLEGCGLVAEVASLRLVQQILATVAVWGALAMGWGLKAAAVTPCLSAAAAAFYVGYVRRRVLLDLLREGPGEDLGWRQHVWPMQWRIALSWLSGWFISQFFSPVLLQYQGASQAGQMGMTLALSQALLPVGAAWMSTKASRFGQLIALEQYAALDVVFFRTLKQSTAVVFAGAICLVLGVALLASVQHPLAARLLPVPLVAVLVSVTVVNHVVHSMALYLRSHKQEPMLGVSVRLGATMAISVPLVGKYFGANGLALTWLGATIVLGLVGGWVVFMRKRREWHSIGSM